MTEDRFGGRVARGQQEPHGQARRPSRGGSPPPCTGRLIVFRVIGCLLSLVALALAPIVAYADDTVQAATTTATYRLVLYISPPEQMLTPEQAAGATSGQVMVGMGGMAGMEMPGTTTDHGQPVNHHLE